MWDKSQAFTIKLIVASSSSLLLSSEDGKMCVHGVEFKCEVDSFIQLQKVARQIPLPHQNWGVAIHKDCYIVFAKAEDDLSINTKIVIYPDMTAKVMFKCKILSTVHLDSVETGCKLQALEKLLHATDKMRL